MRTATPWLTSLILHSLFLFGIVLLTHTPPKFPKQLGIDFQLVPKILIEAEEVVDPEPPVIPPAPVKQAPRTVVKKMLPIKPVPLPLPEPVIKEPEPVALSEPAIKEPEPVAMLEPAAPQDIVVKEAPLLPPAPPDMIAQPETAASQISASIPTVDPLAEIKAAEVVQYVQTVSLIRGQVMNKLRYPTMARKMGWCGKLVLGFTLCADGSVEDLIVVETSGHKVLDNEAMKAVAANTPFKGDYPRTQVRLPITFQLN